MAGQMIACTLAAAGLLLFLWCLAGCFLLPAAGDGLAAVYACRGGAAELEQTVRGFSWLRETGLTEMPLWIVDCGMEPPALELARRLAAAHGYILLWTKETQVNNANGTADPDPRQCGRGNLSE